MRAQNAAHTGAAQLVPPTCCGMPFRTTMPPVRGSATRLTSGTRRSLPAGTPVPVCHGGLLNTTLLPPPLPDQPVSLATVPSALSRRLVPPTPTTAGSDASYSTCNGPVEPCPVVSGLEPASPLETNTLTPAAAS